MTQTWKQPKRPSTDERVKKMWCAVEYYSAIKKNKIIPSVATRMDIKIIILSEVSRTKTNIRYHLYTESKIRIQTDVFMKQKQTHRHGKQTYS